MWKASEIKTIAISIAIFDILIYESYTTGVMIQEFRTSLEKNRSTGINMNFVI